MDLATVLGLIIAWGCLFAALFIEGGRPGDLVLLSPAILVIGGTIGATCITTSLSEIIKMPTYVRHGLMSKEIEPLDVVKKMVGFARQARRDGVLGLESGTRNLDNKFMKQGLELVVDGTPSELIREIMETQIAAMLQRHKHGADMMATAGGFAPTMGIIGTVMGLIHMLKALSDPGAMGPAIAAAFLATLYGVMLANMFFLPIANKLRHRSEKEAAVYEMIIEGVLAIQSGDNPRIVEMKMLAFLAPAQRDQKSTATEEKTESRTGRWAA